jgi:hypothetical protein
LFRTLIKTDLLILDDWGPDRLTASQRRDLMEIIEDRYGRGSTLMTPSRPPRRRPEVKKFLARDLALAFGDAGGRRLASLITLLP